MPVASRRHAGSARDLRRSVGPGSAGPGPTHRSADGDHADHDPWMIPVAGQFEEHTVLTRRGLHSFHAAAPDDRGPRCCNGLGGMAPWAPHPGSSRGATTDLLRRPAGRNQSAKIPGRTSSKSPNGFRSRTRSSIHTDTDIPPESFDPLGIPGGLVLENRGITCLVFPNGCSSYPHSTGGRHDAGARAYPG